MSDKLHEYARKRDFRATPEPRGDETPSTSSRRDERRTAPRTLFVVHKHDASSLHYDFRLEVDGVLKSWAVPKGPSVDPRDKRLAVPTEDHPLDYGDFEGVIPEGEYGAGTVLVWDTGTYEQQTEQDISAGEALERGRLNVWLDGTKLHGGYTLTRMDGRRGRGRQSRQSQQGGQQSQQGGQQSQQGGQQSQWLLIKRKDEGADRRRKPTKMQPRSVLTGSDLREIAAHGEELA